jgi:hypothetical protein
VLEETKNLQIQSTRALRSGLKAALESKKITVVRDRSWYQSYRALIVPLPIAGDYWRLPWKKGTRKRLVSAFDRVLAAIEKEQGL